MRLAMVAVMGCMLTANCRAEEAWYIGTWFSDQRAGESFGQIQVTSDLFSWRGCMTRYSKVDEPHGITFPSLGKDLEKSANSPFETVLLRLHAACRTGHAYIRLTARERLKPEAVEVVPYDAGMKSQGWLLYSRVRGD